MKCRQCGTEIAEKALICYRCGTATSEAKYAPVPIRPARSLVSFAILVLLVIVLFLGVFAGEMGATSAARTAGWTAAVVAALIFALRVRRRR